MLISQVNYALRPDGTVSVSNGMPLRAQGSSYFSHIILWVTPFRQPIAEQHDSNYILFQLVNRIHSVMKNTLKAIKGVLGDMNATSDLLRLVINAVQFAEKSFNIPNLQLFARAFVTITDFNSARSWLSRLYDIISGEAAKQEKILGGWDYLRVSSKAIFLVNDICTTMKWLSSIGVLGAVAAKEIGTVQVFGKTIALTIGRIGTLSTLAGTVPNLLDNIRLVVKYSDIRQEMLEGERRFKRACFSFDTVSDICRIASTVLFCLSNPWFPFLGLVVSTIGTCLSLSKFYYTESTRLSREQEKLEHNAKNEAAMQLCDTYLQLAATNLMHPRVEPVAQRSIRDTIKLMDMSERPFMQQISADELARQVLVRVEQQVQENILAQVQGALQQHRAVHDAAAH